MKKSPRPSLPATELIRCVVIESGSLPLTDSDAESFDQTIVIAQMQSEPAAAFAQRTLERLASVERSGRRFEAATLLAGDHHDADSRSARRLVVMSLSAGVRAHGGVHSLTLCAARNVSPEHRAELLGLAEEVTALREGEHVPVRVRFDEGVPASRRQSGIFSAPHAKSTRGGSVGRAG